MGKAYRNIVLISQLAINVMVPVFLCLFVGIMADRHFGTQFTVPMLILGILAGGRNAYVTAMNSVKREEREAKEAQQQELEEKLRRHGIDPDITRDIRQDKK